MKILLFTITIILIVVFGLSIIFNAFDRDCTGGEMLLMLLGEVYLICTLIFIY